MFLHHDLYFCAVKYWLLLSCFFSVINLSAQVHLTGVVTDSLHGRRMASVSVENAMQHTGSFTDEQGRFDIVVREGDALVFSSVGYKNYILRYKPGMEQTEQKVILNIKPVMLKEVKINQGPSDYQVDSAHRASIYEDAFTYKQTKSAMSPVTSVYQAFSKKHKAMRHFQDQIEDMEQQKFIDTRYTSSLVMSLLDIKEDEASAFMKAYPMEFEYARGASELEIKMWIKYNYKLYKAGGKN